MKTRALTLTSQRGGALLTAVILAAAVGIIVAHILSTSMLEKELTVRTVARLQADNAVEMVVDYGLSDLASRFLTDAYFAPDEFSPGLSPLDLRDEFKDALTDTQIDLDSLFLTGGAFSKTVRYFIDPNDPANRFDPHKGLNVYVRTVDLFGRATIIHPHFGNYTSYGKLTIQVRDAPLFAYAIFYNMDLEFHPGPKMTLTGNVHSNGTIWLCESGGLDFEGVLTAHEDIRVGLKRAGHQTVWTTGHDGSRVKIRNKSDNLQDLHKGGGLPKNHLDSYYTSLSPDFDFTDLDYENWREYATNEFGGNIQSGIHGIPSANPTGIRPYVPDEDGATEKENHAYSLIEPNLPTASPYHKGDAEREKMARKAGLIIRVHRDLDLDGNDDDRGTALPASTLQLRRRPSIDDGWSSAARPNYDWFEPDVATALIHSPGTKSAKEMTHLMDGPALDPHLAHGDIIIYKHANLPRPPDPDAYNTGYFLSFAMLERATQTDPMSALVLTIDPFSGKDQVSEVPLEFTEDYILGQQDYDFGLPADLLRVQLDEAFAAHPFMWEVETGVDHNGDGDTDDFVAGMIDARIADVDGSPGGNSRLNLIEVNMAALADIIEDGDHALFDGYTPKEYFNGVVYVEFPIDTSVMPRSADKILRAQEKMALILTEAGGADPAVGRVPDPDYNKVGNREEGFTLATNAPLYTRGHFNADGKLIGPAPMSSDDPDNPDPPAALMADAITFLSDAWVFADAGIPTGYVPTQRPWANSTEICVALLTGILPTNASATSVLSGGNHNFPRFLESWSSRKLRFRGAMACAFESEIQRDRWSTRYYSPPQRDWGYFDRFAQGDLPPGTPSYPSYRKTAFEFLTKDEFETEIDAIPWSVTVPALP